MSTPIPPANQPPHGAAPESKKKPIAATNPGPAKEQTHPVHNPGTRTNTGADKFR
jgi:hypothetical protein